MRGGIGDEDITMFMSNANKETDTRRKKHLEVFVKSTTNRRNISEMVYNGVEGEDVQSL